MPKVVEIPAGAYEPEDVEVSEESLRAAIEEAQERVAEVKAQRRDARENAPRSVLREALAETDQAYVDAIDALNNAERALGRFLRSDQAAHHVVVDGASESGSVG